MGASAPSGVRPPPADPGSRLPGSPADPRSKIVPIGATGRPKGGRRLAKAIRSPHAPSPPARHGLPIPAPRRARPAPDPAAPGQPRPRPHRDLLAPRQRAGRDPLAARPLREPRRPRHLPEGRAPARAGGPGRDGRRHPAGEPLRLLPRRPLREDALRLPGGAAPRARALPRHGRPVARRRARSSTAFLAELPASRQDGRPGRRAQPAGQRADPLRDPRGGGRLDAGGDPARRAGEAAATRRCCSWPRCAPAASPPASSPATSSSSPTRA